jgi:GNAT superfamily N-acetyltransferase
MGDESVRVRAAGEGDVKTIVAFNRMMALETEALELDVDVLTAGVRAAVGDRHKALYFVAEADGRVLGQLMVTREWSDWRNADIWWIQSVYVAPEARRRGVFGALLRHVEQLAHDAGVAALRLYVERDNDAALQAYERLGMHRSHYAMMEKPL